MSSGSAGFGARATLALHRAWCYAKEGVSLKLGPVTLSSRLRRTAPLSANRRLEMHRPEAAAAQRGEDRCDDAQGPPARAGTALLVGVGPGLGHALALTFARAGMDVAMVARDTRKLAGLAHELSELGVSAASFSCDATDAHSVARMVRETCSELGTPEFVAYNVEEFVPGTILEITPPAFEDCWRANCLGGYLVGREVARLMAEAGRGTIVFTGATGSLRGRAGYINLAVGKFGLRALAQSMARELGPMGVHVAHVVLDGGMSTLVPAAVAQNYLHLHRQPPSAWTHELDLRACTEPW